MSEPIRVLNVVGRMGIGGIETLIMNIYRNIDRSKVQFDFLTHMGSGGAYEEEIRALGGRIYEMPVIRDCQGGKTYYWRVFEYIHALKKFFREHPEYRVLHGHMTNTAAIYMPIAQKYGSIDCCIVHSHQSIATSGSSGVVTNILQHDIWKIATDYFACSEKAAEWIYPQKLIKQGKIKIIHNGVETRKFVYDKERAQKKRAELGIDKDVFVLGSVARFIDVKNHTFMLDIMKSILDEIPNALLLFAGDGEKLQEMKEKAEKLEISDKVRFLGMRSDIPDLLMVFDVFLLPSISEGLPVCAVEAQAAGLPIVASTGVTRETDITGNVSFLDLSLSEDVWAKKIIEVIEHFDRKDMTETVREAGYDIKQTAQWLQNFYLEKANA